MPVYELARARTTTGDSVWTGLFYVLREDGSFSSYPSKDIEGHTPVKVRDILRRESFEKTNKKIDVDINNSNFEQKWWSRYVTFLERIVERVKKNSCHR